MTAGLQACMDGIPAFSAKTKSLKPLDLANFSLPPSVRYQTRNLLLMALIPDSLKNAAQKKYFDFFAAYELNDLAEKGRYNMNGRLLKKVGRFLHSHMTLYSLVS